MRRYSAAPHPRPTPPASNTRMPAEMPRYGHRTTTPEGRKGERTMASRHLSKPNAGTRAVLTEQPQPSYGCGERSTTAPGTYPARRCRRTGPGSPRSS
eukprot:1003597-Alexandrium_andersonii.AAC.1